MHKLAHILFIKNCIFLYFSYSFLRMVFFNLIIFVPSNDHSTVFWDVWSDLFVVARRVYIFIWATICRTKRKYNRGSWIPNECSKHNVAADGFCVANWKVSGLRSILTSPIVAPILFLVAELSTGIQFWSIRWCLISFWSLLHMTMFLDGNYASAILFGRCNKFFLLFQ